MKGEFPPTCLHSESKSKTRLSGEGLGMWLVHRHNIAEHNTYPATCSFSSSFNLGLNFSLVLACRLLFYSN